MSTADYQSNVRLHEIKVHKKRI